MKFNSGEGEKDPFVSYIIESFKTPQQTSLLGMLRFLILSNDENAFDKIGNHIKDKGAADGLIGPKSFSVTGGKDNDFGEILGIGPCTIYNMVNNGFYFRAARGHELNLDFSKTTEAYINGAKREIPQITIKEDGEEKDYTSKHSIDNYYIGNNNQTQEDDGIFVEDARIGIDKDYEGKMIDEKGEKKEKGFYKQISYRLKEGFCFALEVETKSVNLSQYSGSLVKLGADDSSFLFEAIEGGIAYPQDERKDLRVVLLSDAYLPELPDYVRFAITDIKPFRFLHSGNSEKASDYNVKHGQIRREKRYDLYQAGSVFYFKTEKERDDFCGLLDGSKDFVQIGYNRYYAYNKTI